MDVAFYFKMNSLVYIHHDHQFFAPDADSKVPVALGKNIFVTVSHDVSTTSPFDLYDSDDANEQMCSDGLVNRYDECVLEVHTLNHQTLMFQSCKL